MVPRQCAGPSLASTWALISVRFWPLAVVGEATDICRYRRAFRVIRTQLHFVEGAASDADDVLGDAWPGDARVQELDLHAVFGWISTRGDRKGP
jgi:hypothetical protein